MMGVCVCVYVCSIASLVSVNTWTVAHQAPLSMNISRQEYWSGLPFPSLGDLPDPGTEPTSPALAGMFFTTEHQGSPGGYHKDTVKRWSPVNQEAGSHQTPHLPAP